MLKSGQVLLPSVVRTVLVCFILFLMSLLIETGGGSMVGAIKGSTRKEPIVVGKPSTFMMDYVSKQ